jgi:ComF family protein
MLRVLERLMSVVAPFECLVCGVEGRLVCAHHQDVCPAIPARCYRCRAATEAFAVCKSCRSSSMLRHVYVRTELTGLPRALLHLFKFERAQAAAGTIAGYMAEVMPSLNDVLLVPIPTASRRLRERGYDHAALLAKQLSQKCELPAESLLVRLNQTRQVGTKRGERLTQLQGAFRLRSLAAVAGKHVVLVDDVVTTGATLEEVAKLLRRAGAATVDAIVFAQK